MAEVGGHVRILNFDGGGVKGIYTLVMLKRIMDMINVDRTVNNKLQPWQIFDFIGGTSTGGLIAIMLGRLHMTVDECLGAYQTLSQKVFATKPKAWNIRQLLGTPTIDSKLYEATIKDLIQNALSRDPPTGPAAIYTGFKSPSSECCLFRETAPKCKVCIFAAVENEPEVALLRSYMRLGSRDFLSENMEVWQACRATFAASTFVTPFRHPRSGLKFVDAKTSHGNFLQLVLSEARALWPRRAFMIINIGAYDPSAISSIERQIHKSTPGHRNRDDTHGGYIRIPSMGSCDQLYHINSSQFCSLGVDDSNFKVNLAHSEPESYHHQPDFKECIKALSRPWTLSQVERAVIESLRFPDWNTTYNGIGDAAAGTCSWVLQHDAYLQWLQQEQGILWIKGKPGSGKSTLMKFIMGHHKSQQAPSSTISGFFFTWRGVSLENSLEGMLRSLLCQMLEQKQSENLAYLPTTLFQYNRQVLGTEWDWNINDLTDCLMHAVINPERISTCIILDALDECNADQRQTLLDILDNLVAKARSSGQILHLAVSSRSSFNLTVEDRNDVCVEDENGLDLVTFARASLKSVEQSFQEQLVIEIARRAEGMFLWIRLVIRSLLEGLKEDPEEKIFNRLQRIPSGLESLYAHLLDQIITQETTRKSSHQTRLILQWILLATRPLSVQELAYAVCITDKISRISNGHPEFGFQINQSQCKALTDLRVKSRCAGLLEVTAGRRVTFLHGTVRDFLSHNDRVFYGEHTVGNAHSRIAYACLAYLRFASCESNVEFWTSEPKSNTDKSQESLSYFKGISREQLCTKLLSGELASWELNNNATLASFPFLEYALQSWAEHTRLAEKFGGPSSAALLPWLQEDENCQFQKRKVWNDCFKSYNVLREPCAGRDATLLHVACDHNFEGLTKVLCKSGIDVNARGGLHVSPLHVAVSRGYTSIVRLLLSHGADVNVDITSKSGETALALAARMGHVEVVDMLLNAGARLDVQDFFNRVVLWRSILSRLDWRTLETLFKHGLDPPERFWKGQTPLLCLLKEQPNWGAHSHRKATQVKMTELLLNFLEPAALSAVDDVGDTALFYGAAENILPPFISDKYLVKDQIVAVLEQSLPPESNVIYVTCQASWEVLEYFQLEFPGRVTLDSIFTLTGSITAAQGATCGDYVRQFWPATGPQLLHAFEIAIQNHECRISFNPDHTLQIQLKSGDRVLGIPEVANIQVRGTVSEVTETLEQLAWLGATFRLPLPGSLSMSYIRFGCFSKEETKPMNTHGSIATRLKLLSARHQDPEPKQPGTCWVQLFNQSILARGFPLTTRSDGKGLDISPSMMIAAAGVQKVENHNNGLFFLGETSMLYPTGKCNDSIQWHFVEAEDKIALLKILKESPDRLYTLDLEQLIYGRSFLGVYGNCLVHLGTREAMRHKIEDSGLPSTSQRIELVKEVTPNLGIRPPGLPVSFGLGLKAQLTPRQLDRTPGRNLPSYHDRLEIVMRKPTLVYDSNTNTAWMVSQLSVVLHLVLGYLLKREPRLYQFARYHLPYAKASADSGQAALQAIHEKSSMELWKEKGEDKPILLRKIVEHFLDVFESREFSGVLKELNSGFKFPSGLVGWDFKELESLRDFASPRSLSRNHKAAWWKFTKESPMLVIFGADFGQIICPDRSKMKVCSQWELIPAYKDLLVATIPVLKDLARSHDQEESCHCLTKKIRWCRPFRSRLFREICNESCNPVQELCKRNLLKFCHASHLAPGPLCEDGAVIFGVHADYCQNPACYAKELLETGWGDVILSFVDSFWGVLFYFYFQRIFHVVAILFASWRIYYFLVGVGL